MSVLLMQLVPADFAFVLHSVNPLTGSKDEVLGEVCVGLGEALVGNEPGRAFCFVANKTNVDHVQTLAIPSKLLAHASPASDGGKAVYFARSDSNGEDLEHWAGAGLYDSVASMPTECRIINYADEWLVWDGMRRVQLLSRLARLAKQVEQLRGGPQDIEGAIVGDRIVLLQARAQA